jgi:hypothetical protein
MQIDPTLLSNIILIVTAFSIAFVITLWASLIIWVARDTLQRIKDPLVRILAILLVVILFIPGIVIYLILRPKKTLEDEYQRALEEEALLQSIENRFVCPNCGADSDTEWSYCPNCHSQIKQKCKKCDHVFDLRWKICPYCGNSVIDTHDLDLDLDLTIEGSFD